MREITYLSVGQNMLGQSNTKMTCEYKIFAEKIELWKGILTKF